MNRVKLEANPSILENKLLLNDFKNEDKLSIFPSKEKDSSETIPWKYVTPSPGFCAKFHTPEGDKIFLNICHTSEVPAPKDVSETELIQIIESEGKICYTVPMSIGELHVEADKSGNLCSVYDIALSTSFCNKCKSSDVFTGFLMMVAANGIEDKYKLNLNMQSENPYVIMKNRKALGTLQAHRVQQRPVKSPPRPLIEEMSESSVNKDIKHAGHLKSTKSLKLELHPNTDKPERLIATVETNVLSGENLQLDVGEDRIILVNLEKHKLIFDVFIPVNVDPDSTESNFDTVTQILEINMPLIKSVK